VICNQSKSEKYFKEIIV